MLFVERFLDALEVREVVLVGHGWGAAIGLIFAQRHPDRVTRLAIIDAVPLLDGFEWPAIVRWLRRPGIGELVMGSVNRWMLARILRRGSATPEAWPDARVDAVWEQFDQGTQRAILRLHRSVDAAALAAAGEGLAELEQPALVSGASRTPGWPPRSPTPTPRASPTPPSSAWPAPGTGRGSTSRRWPSVSQPSRPTRAHRDATAARPRARAPVNTTRPRVPAPRWARLAPVLSPRCWRRPT